MLSEANTARPLTWPTRSSSSPVAGDSPAEWPPVGAKRRPGQAPVGSSTRSEAIRWPGASRAEGIRERLDDADVLVARKSALDRSQLAQLLRRVVCGVRLRGFGHRTSSTAISQPRGHRAARSRGPRGLPLR